MKLSTEYRIERDKVELLSEVKPDGVHLIFLKELSPKTWERRFEVILTTNNIYEIHESFARLAYETGVWRIDHVRIESVRDFHGEENLALMIVPDGRHWFKVTIQKEPAKPLFTMRLRIEELINILDESKRFLILPA